jgi:hypothetical protein
MKEAVAEVENSMATAAPTAAATAAPASPSVQVKLEVDVATANSAEFQRQFLLAAAQSLGVPVERLQIGTIKAGSALVTIHILDPPSVLLSVKVLDENVTSTTASNNSNLDSNSLAQLLHQQAVDPNSSFQSKLADENIPVSADFTPQLQFKAAIKAAVNTPSNEPASTDAPSSNSPDYSWLMIFFVSFGLVLIIIVLAWLAANYHCQCCSGSSDEVSPGTERRKKVHSILFFNLFFHSALF